MKHYTYRETVDHLAGLPHFAPPKGGTGKASDYFSLDAENALLDRLGNPHMDLKYVHVAGSNGKGSTCAYIASILQASGIRTGLFTSPFFRAYNEMIRVDGEDIPDEDFADIFSLIKPHIDELAAGGIVVSEYEILTVMGICAFKRRQCEIVVLEVGMGGSVDSTNVIPSPLVSVIAPISFDHMSMLGNTLTEIATEKAGIIKAETTVVAAAQDNEVSAVIDQVCEDRGVEIEYVSSPRIIDRSLKGQTFEVKDRGVFETSLLGTYQPDNAALAITVADKLMKLGYPVSDTSIRAGIKQTKWFGRFSLIENDPPVVIDGGHNRQGAKVLRDSLETYFSGKKITFILGILRDKEVDLMLDTLLPPAREVYTVDVPNPRTMDAQELAEHIRERGVSAEVITEINEYHSIAQNADVVCIAGSLYLIGMLYDRRLS